MLAQEGDALAPGQSIVQLEAPDLRARRDTLAAQLAELEAGPRKEEIGTAKAELLAESRGWLHYDLPADLKGLDEGVPKTEVLPNGASATTASCAKPKGPYSLAASAYAQKDTCYDREYLFQFSEISSVIHEQVESQLATCSAANRFKVPCHL